jgi:two-component system, sensor histidine kinase and response regulator
MSTSPTDSNPPDPAQDRANPTEVPFLLRTTLALAADLRLTDVLHLCAQSMVDHLDAAFARIWILSDNKTNLELKASAGRYTHLDGQHSIIRVGEHRIGKIASAGQPLITNDIPNDPRMGGDMAWAVEEGFVSFAGYPLLFRGELVGVAAIFARKPLSDSVLQALAITATNIALLIERTHAEAKLERFAAQQQATNAELKAASRRSQLVIETVPNGILIVNRKGIITLANSTAAKMFGYQNTELVGRPVETLLPPTLSADHPGLRSSYFARPEARSMGAGSDLFAISKMGTQFPVEVGLSPIETDGELSVLCSIVDITERKQANVALLAASRRAQLVIEAVPIGILIVSRAGVITLSNSGVEKMFGYGLGELVGQPLETLVAAEYREASAERHAQFFAHPHAQSIGRDGQYYCRHRDGSAIPVQFEIIPIETDGEVSALCAVVDITERKMAEEKLHEAGRMKSEFLANMSHEIRTPMNVLIGVSGLLLDTELTADQRDFAQTIQKGAESLLVVVNDVLDFSKLEAGKLEIDPVDFSVDEVAEDTTDFFTQQALRRGLALTCQVSDSVPAWLRGDGGRLRQILTNLIGNAMKFTEKGEVSLQVSLAGQEDGRSILRFQVSDTGIGISREVQKNLFQAFTQADGSTTRRYGGTGLGLAICRRLVALMGGSIGVESHLGQGSRFWFQLPFDPPVLPQEPGVRESNKVAGKRLLIVDGHASERRLMEQYAASWGMRADTAENGLLALTLLREAAQNGEPYDVAVLDFDMAGMTGIDVARVMQWNQAIAGTALVLVTSYENRNVAHSTHDLPSLICLIKPVRKQPLLKALVRALHPEPVGQANKSRRGQTPNPLHGARLLLVEDNEDNQKLAARLLEKHGYECDFAANGSQALACMEAANYPLVLMDCQMPIMDGFQATAAIREREKGRRHTPVVALTAHALAGDRERCLSAGMDDYLSKPIKESTLISVVERWLAVGQGAQAPVAAAPPNTTWEPPYPQTGPIPVQPPEGLEDLIPGYLSNCQQHLLSLSAAVDRGDLQAAQTIGHGMKGSGAGYGFPAISGIGRSIEQLAGAHDAEGIRRQTALLEDYLARLQIRS